MTRLDRPLGFCIVGAGNIGRVHAKAIEHIPQARLTVVSSRNAERGRALAAPYGAVWVADWHEAIARPDVDVVCICTPTGVHAEPAVAAAHAKKHLVVEKPLDITLERARQIVAAAQENHVKATCIFPYRCMEGSLQAKKAVASGRLGRLTLASASVNWYRTQEYYDKGGWRGTWELDGGGALMNQSIHAIDLFQWLAGPVTTVYGRIATLAHQMSTEDTGAALVTLPGGALGLIQGATSCWPGEPARVALYGDQGSIVLEEGRITVWKLADAAPGEEKAMLSLETSQGSGSGDPTGITYELHRRQLADMVQAIAQDRAPTIDVAEGLPAIAIIRAIYQSAASGQTVTIA